ncbi:MAG: hypothetical protein GTN36_03565 [Candidatus Aenigmarchaeota archaeon]|nr:hypothetical protein [Candidatus Aenigmarchaeota archaeon]
MARKRKKLIDRIIDKILGTEKYAEELGLKEKKAMELDVPLTKKISSRVRGKKWYDIDYEKPTTAEGLEKAWEKSRFMKRQKAEREMISDVLKEDNKLYNHILRLAKKGSERHKNMLKNIKAYVAQGVDIDTAVRKAYSGANISYAMKRQKQAEAAGDTELAGHFKRMRGHALAKTKEGQQISYTKSPPPPPPERSPSFAAIARIAGKGPQLKIFQVLIFIIAAICSIVIPPMFGIPSRTFLAIGFIFVGIYNMFPSERSVMREIGVGERISAAGAGTLTAKAFFKLGAFVYILWDFFLLNRILGLVFGFIFYFNLPLRYKTSQPYNMILGWIRLGLGFFLAYQIALTFSGPLFWPLGLLAGAFFIALPTHIADPEGGVVTINLGSKATKGLQFVERTLFSLVMLAALITFLGTMGMGLTNINWNDISVLLYFSVWLFSIASGISAGPEGRPVIGVVMIILSLFIFSTTYTGYVGTSIFGVFWPQVQGFGEVYLSPLGDIWAQAQSSLSDTWLIMTNPQQYYLLQQQKEQATKTVIMTGGTPLSIELTKSELQPSLIGILEPSEPTIGIMELHNKGDFTSGEIDLDIWSTWVNSTTLEETPIGKIINLECSSAFAPFGSSIDSPISGDPANCQWTGDTYPTEMRSVTYLLEPGPDPWSYLFTDCLDNSVDPPMDCSCFTPACSVGNTTYKYGGMSVKVNANLTYEYIVNVSIPIEVMNFGVYLNKLQTREIVLHDLTSEYTGGPIKATLWTPKQPARTDIPFLVVASIYNNGQGELLKIEEFEITVYGKDTISGVNVLGSTFRTSSPQASAIPDGCGAAVADGNGNWIITCSNTYIGDIVEPGEWKRVSFYITPSATIEEQKTTQIIGRAEYTYRKTTSQQLQMANAPPQ